MSRRYPETLLASFRVTPSGCWLWTGHLDRDGYGRVRRCGSWVKPHRASYELHIGPIPEGLEIDHLCRNRACVNPEHLEPVTHAENMRRSAPAQKTHCVNGHLYDEANTYIRPNGSRDCRRCVAERQRRYQARKKAA